VSGAITVEGRLFSGPGVGDEVASVVRPEEKKTRDDLHELKNDFSHRFDQLNQSLLSETKPGPAANLPATTPSSGLHTPVVILPRPEAPPPCSSDYARSRAIPFSILVMDTGAPEISSNEIERSIQSYLPSTQFYAVASPACAAIQITVMISIDIREKVRNGMTADDITSTASISYLSIASGHTEVIPTKFSRVFLEEAFVDSPNWPEKCVVSGSIYSNLNDSRLTNFLRSEFSALVKNPLTTFGSPPQCAAG
jgi:hypothetical protein